MENDKIDCLDLIEFSLGNSTKLVVQHKYHLNNHYIDFRKWSNFHADTFWPTGKGVQVRVEKWMSIINPLKDFIEKSARSIDQEKK